MGLTIGPSGRGRGLFAGGVRDASPEAPGLSSIRPAPVGAGSTDRPAPASASPSSTGARAAGAAAAGPGVEDFRPRATVLPGVAGVAGVISGSAADAAAAASEAGAGAPATGSDPPPAAPTGGGAFSVPTDAAGRSEALPVASFPSTAGTRRPNSRRAPGRAAPGEGAETARLASVASVPARNGGAVAGDAVAVFAPSASGAVPAAAAAHSPYSGSAESARL